MNTDLMNIPKKCPCCGAEPMLMFLRGQVARLGRAWYWPFKERPRFAIICRDCKEVVGYEWNCVIDLLGVRHLPPEEAKVAIDLWHRRTQEGVCL